MDTTRTCRLLTTLALYTCGILKQQVFNVADGELISFSIKIGFRLEAMLLFFFFIVCSFCFFLLETVYAWVMFVLYAQEEPRESKPCPFDPEIEAKAWH